MGPGGARRRSEIRQAIRNAARRRNASEGVVPDGARHFQIPTPRAADLVLKCTVGRPAAALPEARPARLPLPDLNSSIACGKAAEVVVSAVENQARSTARPRR